MASLTGQNTSRQTSDAEIVEKNIIEHGRIIIKRIKKLLIFFLIDQFKHQNPMLTYQLNFVAAKTLACSTEAHSPHKNKQFNPYDSKCQQRQAAQRKSDISLVMIKDKLSQIDNTTEKKQKNGFERVLALLKEERDAITKLRQQKRLCLPQLWKGFGALMILQREKFQSDYMSQTNHKIKQQLYVQLLAKNSSNIKAVKQFKKKIQLKSSQQKLNSKDLQQNSQKIDFQQKFSLQYNIQDVIKQNTMYLNRSADRGDKSTKIQKISNKACTIKIRSRPLPYRLATNRSIHQTQSDEIKAKVQSAFKSLKKYQTFGRNILNSIVFDATNVLSNQKRKHYIKNLQKRNYRKQQKNDQSTKVLLRVGGIRLSLQDTNRYKTMQT